MARKNRYDDSWRPEPDAAEMMQLDDSPDSSVPDPFAGWPFFWSDEPEPGVSCGQPFISGRRIFGLTRAEAMANWRAAYNAGELFETSTTLPEPEPDQPVTYEFRVPRELA